MIRLCFLLLGQLHKLAAQLVAVCWMALPTAPWCLEQGREEWEPGVRLRSGTGFCWDGNSLHWLSCSAPCSPSPQYTWFDLVPSRSIFLSRKLFFSFAGIIFCHISELNQPAEGVPRLGFTTDSMSHAVVPKLIGNASKRNVSVILSPGRSSDSYFCEMRMQSLRRFCGCFCPHALV